MGVDEAFDRMRDLLSTLPKILKKDISEADTRAKIIDPVFKGVLGWPEESISREEPSNEGFADYVFTTFVGRPYLLVEAKRARPRFDLQKRDREEVYLIGGSALSGKDVKRTISQAAGYAPNLGCPFAVITDGQQYVLFEAIKDRVLRDRKAITFTNLADARQFRAFYELLSAEAVTNASLSTRFLRELDHTEPLHVPLAFVNHADENLPRNKLWSILNHLATRILDDRPENRLDIIEHCYVGTRESSESVLELRELLSRPPSRLIREAGSTVVKPSGKGRTSIGNELEKDVKDRRPGVYVLTGGVGSGKTTFVSRFEHVVEPAMVHQFCAWFQVDFLPSGKPATDVTGVENYIFKVVREQLKSYSELSFDGAALRALFAHELSLLEATLLFGIPPDAPERLTVTNGEVDRLFKSDKAVVVAAVRRLISLGRRTVFILDNSDQLGEEFQESVFLTARALQEEFAAICVVSLREEKFYAAYYRGVLNAFPTHKFHIGSPDLQEVLRQRLKYGVQLLESEPQKFFPTVNTDAAALNLDDCIELLRAFIHSVTHANRNIVRMLESVAAGNIRFALEIFRDFVGSGNTQVGKILEIHRRQPNGYNVPFHEFAKSVMLGNREFYREGSSPIANLYARSGATRTSHFTSLRILSYLQSRQKAVSGHGTGFVEAGRLRDAFAHAFEMADDFELCVGHLVQKDLVESEPPRSTDVAAKTLPTASVGQSIDDSAKPARALAYKIAASGAYYLNYLVRSVAYVDQVMFDTAIADESFARDLAATARIRDLSTRVGRVRNWLAYLVDLEHLELAAVRPGSEIVEPMMPSICEQIEREVDTFPPHLFGNT